MPFYNQEEIEKAREVDLFTYLQACEPQELVHVSGMSTAPGNTTACVFPMANGAGFPVGSAVTARWTTSIKVKGCSFMEAMEAVAGRAAAPPPSFTSVPREEKPKHLLLPPPAPNNQAMLDYLKGRGISMEVLDFCVRLGAFMEQE